MNQAPLVTVVIPTYNDAGFLHKALQSLCAQSFSDWEAVVVNNYSVDNTIMVVESFSEDLVRRLILMLTDGRCWSMTFVVRLSRSVLSHYDQRVCKGEIS